MHITKYNAINWKHKNMQEFKCLQANLLESDVALVCQSTDIVNMLYRLLKNLYKQAFSLTVLN